MKILLLAPQPFFQERGTPIAVDLLIRTLVAHGHVLDVLTYHEGETPNYGLQVRIVRIRRPVLVGRVPPGFSLAKIACDIALWERAHRLAHSSSYDIVHAVEEAVFIALALQRSFSLPYVYDMDSSLPQQMIEKLAWLRPFGRLMESLEAVAIRNAAAVLPVCDALAEVAKRHGARRVAVLRDVPLLEPARPETVVALRHEFGSEGPLVLYVGNLEPYQGIQLLLESFAIVATTVPHARLLVIGGTSQQIRLLKNKATSLGIASQVAFGGPRPLKDLGSLCAAADVLVSPRLKGVNTPMKIYSYMLAGKPIVATNIASHVQVLSPDNAVLVPPEPMAFAKGMLRVLQNPDLGQRLGQAARQIAQTHYGMDTYRKVLWNLYEELEKDLHCGHDLVGRRDA
ncbi:MAG: glycosyltransferase family 4 protein [Kiritimatiellia bacterium]